MCSSDSPHCNTPVFKSVSFVVLLLLALPSDNGQQWPLEHRKALFHIKLLHLIDLVTDSSLKNMMAQDVCYNPSLLFFTAYDHAYSNVIATMKEMSLCHQYCDEYELLGKGQQHIQKTDPSSRQRGRPTKQDVTVTQVIIMWP
jgi:hypothetical protein